MINWPEERFLRKRKAFPDNGSFVTEIFAHTKRQPKKEDENSEITSTKDRWQIYDSSLFKEISHVICGEAKKKIEYTFAAEIA